MMMQKSTELIQLEILEVRLVDLDEKQKRRSWSLKLGFIGEAEVELWIKKYGNKHWHLIHDYWFYNKKTMQADFLIIKENQWLVIEVKNFDGKFEYKNHECTINHRLMDDDIMMSMSSKVSRLKRIASEVSAEIEVLGAMVFINEHCQVEIEQHVDFEIILRNQFKNFLKRHNDFMAMPLMPDHFNQVQKVLNRYVTKNPFQPTGFPVENFGLLRKGVTCKDCHSFDIDLSMKNVTCRDCHSKELKSDAILRSAEQLRYVFFDNAEMVTTRNVYEFTGGQISQGTIRKVLGNSYRKNGSTKAAYYEIE